MTIDEAIAKYNKLANNDRTCHPEEAQQLAEWLELLKWYEQGMEDIPYESGVLPKDVYRAGYNKALDDFVKLVKEHNWNIRNRNENEFIYGAIDRLSEQLKAGEIE